MLNDKDYMTLIETAAAMNVSRQWLYQLLKSGNAPAHIRLGGRTLFERASVQDHCKAATRGGGG